MTGEGVAPGLGGKPGWVQWGVVRRGGPAFGRLLPQAGAPWKTALVRMCSWLVITEGDVQQEELPLLLPRSRSPAGCLRGEQLSSTQGCWRAPTCQLHSLPCRPGHVGQCLTDHRRSVPRGLCCHVRHHSPLSHVRGLGALARGTGGLHLWPQTTLTGELCGCANGCQGPAWRTKGSLFTLSKEAGSFGWALADGA